MKVATGFHLRRRGLFPSAWPRSRIVRSALLSCGVLAALFVAQGGVETTCFMRKLGAMGGFGHLGSAGKMHE